MQPPPRSRQQRSAASPGTAAVAPTNCGTASEAQVEEGETSSAWRGDEDGETSATAVADKEEVWRQRQAILRK